MASTNTPAERPVALVTGASSGIGQAYAERLAADGYDLAVVARRADRLEELKQRLEADFGVVVEPVVADLSTEDGQAAVDEVATDRRLEFVVDNAALAHYMPFLELAPERVEELVKLNALAPARLIRAALPGMVERRKGALVSVATQLVFSATQDNPQLPQRAVYAATKSFLFTLLRLLAHELKDTGVSLQVVCPGVVRTEFHTRQGMDMSHMPRLEPAHVVEASMRGLELDELVCIPALEDRELLERRDEAERAVFTGGLRAELAGRYA